MVFAYIGVGLLVLYWICWLSSLKHYDDLFVPLSGWVVAASLLVPAYGGYRWLKYGEWESITLRQGLLNFFPEGSRIFDASGWVGIDAMAEKYLESSLGWTVLAVGFVMFFSASFWAEEGEKRRKKAQLRDDST